MMPERDTDQDLLRRVLAGESAAREAFVRRFAGIIHQALRQTLRIREVPHTAQDIEDIFHAVFLQLLENDARKLRQYRGEKGCSVASWIRIVTVRCVLNLLRRRGVDALAFRGRRVPLDAVAGMETEGDDPAARLEDAEQEKLLAQGLDTLPPREALLLRLHFEHDLGAPEIAEILHTSVSNVYTLKHRALQRLKRCIKAIRGGEPGKPERPHCIGENSPPGPSSAAGL